MNSRRLPKDSQKFDYVLEKLVDRGGGLTPHAATGSMSRSDQLKEVFSRCFAEDEEEEANLKDEFPAGEIETVISKCQGLLRSLQGAPECWLRIGELLNQKLWKLVRLKEDLAEAEKKVQMVRQKLAEASKPLDGVTRETRVMACLMLLAEKEMVRDGLRNRVSMIIDQFVTRILAGTQHEPGGEALELRLRGVFGSL